MDRNHSDAWVLHLEWRGETSAEVHFFTREWGVLVARVRNARKHRALLQPFIPLWLHTTVSRERRFVNALEACAPPIQLSGEALFSGLYLNELISLCFRANEAQEGLFSHFARALEELANVENRAGLEVLLREFEWTLLLACGYAPSLDREAESGLPVRADGFYGLRPGVGLVACDTGISGAHIQAMREGNLSDIHVRRSAKRLMQEALKHALGGRPIRTRELFAGLRNNRNHHD
ncbi:DNA repair protein RecO [Legionella geestiana]|uniref:DNA repair protein RecO n=1 Tax=Legionella geestiana TaxID=45065 RepID=A0A0W0TVL7_9GAMM|nr:DNA repair protein RecO C-terminal domain-containing protein [Legionella geestiana]KTC99668.1 DNA repair protein RecO [Legionella geestiana]QBS13209.1 DNA repair protein RecO [Legionella geestiana]STX54269.1 DNA repair protein RecO [Legionella geestiana]